MTRVVNCFQSLGFVTYHEALAASPTANEINPELLKGLEEFREHLGGELTIMLLEGVGQGTEHHEMHIPSLDKAVTYLHDSAQ